MSRLRRLATLVLLLATALAGPVRGQDDARQEVVVLERAVIAYEEDEPARTDGTFVARWNSQTLERTVTLPDPAARGGRRITAIIDVQPILRGDADDAGPDPEPGAPPPPVRPNDPWTRLGGLWVVNPDDAGGTQPSEVELVRFVTGYGGGIRQEVDLTAFEPLLRGRRTLRLAVTSYSERPGFRVSLRLRYESGAGGRRDPFLARPVLDDPHVDHAVPRVRGTVQIPSGIDVPRLRILTTGHSTIGRPAHEFLTCTHVLLVDGREVLRWRPWRENGPELRPRNPWAGRQMLAGRSVWASDYDRSGWAPGLVVDPLVVPVPELGPGRHMVEIRVEGIEPPLPEGTILPDGTDASGEHGYWAISAAVLADRAWE